MTDPRAVDWVASALGGVVLVVAVRLVATVDRVDALVRAGTGGAAWAAPWLAAWAPDMPTWTDAAAVLGILDHPGAGWVATRGLVLGVLFALGCRLALRYLPPTPRQAAWAAVACWAAVAPASVLSTVVVVMAAPPGSDLTSAVALDSDAALVLPTALALPVAGLVALTAWAGRTVIDRSASDHDTVPEGDAPDAAADTGTGPPAVAPPAGTTPAVAPPAGTTPAVAPPAGTTPAVAPPGETSPAVAPPAGTTPGVASPAGMTARPSVRARRRAVGAATVTLAVVAGVGGAAEAEPPWLSGDASGPWWLVGRFLVPTSWSIGRFVPDDPGLLDRLADLVGAVLYILLFALLLRQMLTRITERTPQALAVTGVWVSVAAGSVAHVAGALALHATLIGDSFFDGGALAAWCFQAVTAFSAGLAVWGAVAGCVAWGVLRRAGDGAGEPAPTAGGHGPDDGPEDDELVLTGR